MTKSKIIKIGNYAPERIISNAEIEKLVNVNRLMLPEGLLKEKFGIEERRFGTENEQASDLAVGAALKILEPCDIDTIDCLIFASGSSDMIEPATSSIIQSKLKLTCPAVDIKNACNSFVCGMQTANAFIISGEYKKIMVVSGEKLSAIIKLHYEDNLELMKRFACLSMGDAGAAVLMEKSEDESGIYIQKFQTNGEYWELCTVPGGGSMYPHDGSKVYFEGRTTEMRKVFFEKKGKLIESALNEAGWLAGDLDHVFMHHVSVQTFELVANDLGIPKEKFYSVFEKYGNMAACSIPFAMSDAYAKNVLKKGDKIMLLGLASGISISVQLLIW